MKIVPQGTLKTLKRKYYKEKRNKLMNSTAD